MRAPVKERTVGAGPVSAARIMALTVPTIDTDGMGARIVAVNSDAPVSSASTEADGPVRLAAIPPRIVRVCMGAVMCRALSLLASCASKRTVCMWAAMVIFEPNEAANVCIGAVTSDCAPV